MLRRQPDNLRRKQYACTQGTIGALKHQNTEEMTARTAIQERSSSLRFQFMMPKTTANTIEATVKSHAIPG